MIRVSQTFDLRANMDVVARNHELRTPHFILSLNLMQGGLFDQYVSTESARALGWAVLRMT